MRCLIVCCLLALAVCQSITYAKYLSPNEVYEYKYVGEVKVGATNEQLPVSALKISSIIKITGGTEPNYFIQFADVKIEALNGLKGEAQYESMRINERVAIELAKPFGFRYANGHVSHITTPPGVSTTMKNFGRGALDMLAVTHKGDMSFYELEEESIHGICKNDYIQIKDVHTGVVTLRRIVDLQSCRVRAVLDTGMASAVPNALSRTVGSSIETNVHYNYTLRPGKLGLVISEVFSQENQQSTPFNLKTGHLTAATQKSLQLLKITEKYHDIDCGEMEYAGELMYKFDNVDLNMPVVMQDLDQPVQKAQQLIQKLARQINSTHIAAEANLDYQRLYQLYRAMNASGVDLLWENNKIEATRRALFLSTITESADVKVIDFIIEKVKASEINEVEASQLVVIALNHVTVTREIIDKAKDLLKIPCSQSNTMLWKAAVLAYGSLIRKHIIVKKQCSPLEIEPLLTLLNETLQVAQYTEEKVITILKGVGNSGCPLALKYLRRILSQQVPGRLVTARIMFSALQSVRLMADIDKAGVQAFTRDVFIKETVSTELRMLAVKQLLETRPEHNLMVIIMETLMTTGDQELGIFTYSYMKSFAESKTPDNYLFSTEAASIVSSLAGTYEKLSSKYNKAFRFDRFHDNLLMGHAVSQFVMNVMKTRAPEHIILNVQSLVIGRVMSLTELGFEAHGLIDILQNVEPDTLASLMSRLTSSPTRDFTLSFYWHVFGQELFYIDVNRDTIDKIKTAIFEVWKNGGQFQSLKPFMVFEARHIQANILGVPMEFSKYYHSVSRVNMEVDPPISPLTINRTIIQASRGYLSMDKQYWTFFGVNTNLFQCAAELKTKMSVLAPWEIRSRLDIDERKYSFEFPLPENPVDLFKLRSETHAIIRALGSEEKKIEIFPSVANNLPSELKCYPILPGLSMCPLFLYGGTENEFEGAPSFFFSSKLMFLKALAGKDAKKIRITLDLEPEKKEPNVTGVDVLTHAIENRESNCTAIPIFLFEIVAMNQTHPIGGWRLSGYHWEGKPLYDVSYILAQVESESNWMMCVDTSVPNLGNALISTRFGSRCQPYRISLRTETRPAGGFLNNFSAFLNWGQLPEKIHDLFQRIMIKVPGYLTEKGFTMTIKNNTANQVDAHVTPNVHRERKILINFPKQTYERTDIKEFIRRLIGEDAFAFIKKAVETYI